MIGDERCESGYIARLVLILTVAALEHVYRVVYASVVSDCSIRTPSCLLRPLSVSCCHTDEVEVVEVVTEHQPLASVRSGSHAGPLVSPILAISGRAS